jgi:hypothetical protein
LVGNHCALVIAYGLQSTRMRLLRADNLLKFFNVDLFRRLLGRDR